MPIATKANKTVQRTKGAQSESQRVNSLLRFALNLERKAALEREAASFFAGASGDPRERRAFKRAGIAAWSRD
jgi:hypothetical protein